MKHLYESSLLSIAEKPLDIIWHPNSEKVAVIMDSENKDLYGVAINGGCSLRKKSEMLDCLQKVSWDIIEKYYPKIKLHNEDLFFTFACHLLGKMVPKKDERQAFAIENEDVENTCFYHGWHKSYQTEEEARKLLGLP